MISNLADALTGWRRIVGSEHVSVAATDLSALETATFATTQKVAALVRPANVREVQASVRMAHDARVPLYPVSRGRNWGLGSRVPVRSGCAVLDLSRLDHIVDYHERLAYITVEPGVTFRQAAEFLASRASPHVLSATGGPPEGSIVGNVVERGHGEGPYGIRLDHVCNLEVVTATGDLIRTGFGPYAGASAAEVDRWGVGPSLDGLFTQSNLGIVTRLTAWLMPRPHVHQLFQLSVRDVAQLAGALDGVQQLMLHDVLRANSIVFWNSYKVLARLGRYPFALTNGETPLSLQSLKGGQPWYATGSIYAPSAEVAHAEQRVIRDALAGCVGTLEFPPLDAADAAPLGQPSDRNLRSMYWRKRDSYPSDFDPDRDQCGVIWLCPAFPFDGATIARAVGAAETLVERHGFEPNIGLACVSARSVHAFVMIMYDRDVDGEDARAMRCHDELFDVLVRDGHLPYRLGIQSMDAMPEGTDASAALSEAIKAALDPHRILAPGRYDRRPG